MDIIFILDTCEKDKLSKISKEGEKTKQSTPMIISCTAEHAEAEEENKHLEIKEEIMDAFEYRIEREKYDTKVFMFLIYYITLVSYLYSFNKF